MIAKSSAASVATRTEDLLNGEGPELPQILQLLHESGVVENAEAGAHNGL